jgi:hypothetical protein
MPKHKLLELQKIIEERTGSLTEKVEIVTNVKLNPLYIADRKDEIEFLQWIIRVIQPILNRDIDHQQLGITKKRLELMQTIEFENTLQDRVQELKSKLKDCNNLCESDILINEIDILESILGRLSDLKYGAETRAIEVANATNDFKQASRLRKQLIKIQDAESEISAQKSCNTISNLKMESSTVLLLVEYIAWPIASSTFDFESSLISIARECFLSTTIVVNGRLLDELYGLILLIDIFPFCASSFLASFLINSFMGANTVTITPRVAASRRNWPFPASNVLLNPFSAEKSRRISL